MKCRECGDELRPFDAGQFGPLFRGREASAPKFMPCERCSLRRSQEYEAQQREEKARIDAIAMQRWIDVLMADVGVPEPYQGLSLQRAATVRELGATKSVAFSGPMESVRHALASWNPSDDAPLYLQGAWGSGKTLISFALVIDHVRNVRGEETTRPDRPTASMWIDMPTFARRAQRSALGNGDSFLDKICDVETLVIDDLGQEASHTPFVIGTFKHVWDVRSTHSRGTVLTGNTNLSDREWFTRVYGPALADRLCSTCRALTMPGGSKRGARR